MKRITLAVVAVLLAVPALAQAKAGIEFDQNIEASQPGDRQGFSVFIHGSSGGPPTVSFQNTRTGQIVDARTVRTNGAENFRGSVVFPDVGPWTATLAVGGHPVSGMVGGSTFELTPPPSRPAAAPPAQPEDDAFPLWLWLTTLGAIGSAVLVFVMRRRGHWGAA